MNPAALFFIETVVMIHKREKSTVYSLENIANMCVNQMQLRFF